MIRYYRRLNRIGALMGIKRNYCGLESNASYARRLAAHFNVGAE
jgi:hypothetical protein